MANEGEKAVVLQLRHTPTLGTTLLRLSAAALALSVCAVVDRGPVFWAAIVVAVVWGAFALASHFLGRRVHRVLVDENGLTLPSRFLRRDDRISWSNVRFAVVQESDRVGAFRVGVQSRLGARLLQSTEFESLEDFRRVHMIARTHIAPDRFLDLSARAWFMPWVTIALMIAVSASFVVGALLLDLPQSIEAIYLGAFQHDLVASGDWFRINSFSVAHLDALHFALNLFMFTIVCGEIEERIGRVFVMGLIGVSSLCAGVAILLLPSSHDITLGASGICYGAMGSLLALTYLSPQQAPPSFRLVAPWWLTFLLVVDLVQSVLSPGISLAGHVGGLVGGVAITLLYIHAKQSSSALLQRAHQGISIAAGAFFVACLVGLLHAGLSTAPRVIAERLLAADIAADTALDVSNFVSRDAAAPAPLLQRAFAVLSEPERAGKEKIAEGAYGVLREDTLGRIAWRLDMLGEARAHGLDAYRRGDDVTPDERKRLLARLAVYESSARLPSFVPAAVLVRAGTLCVLVPAGNPRQYIRAVVRSGVRGNASGGAGTAPNGAPGVATKGAPGAAARNADQVVGMVLGTVDPGETRCIPAEGVLATSRVALTASERALLTSDLVYRPVDTSVAALLPRGERRGVK